MSKKFEVNFQDLFEIDITPDAPIRTFKRLGAGISSLAPATNENVDQSTYLDGDGYGSSDVIGAQLTFSGSGHRVTGDPAQDFIASKEFELGDARKTNFRYFDSNGVQKRGPCTLANIQNGGGDPQSKKEFSFEIHINGKPEKIEPVPAAELTITPVTGSKEGTVKVTVAPDEKNTLAYRVSNTKQEANLNSYAVGVTHYTSGNDITIAAGQFLNIYELNEYKRVVKFDSVKIQVIP